MSEAFTGRSEDGPRSARIARPPTLPDFTAIGLLVVRVDTGVCVSANRALYRMVGAREQRVLGASWESLLVPTDRRRVARALERLIAGVHAPIDVHLQRRDGSTTPVRAEANVIAGRSFEGLALLSFTESDGDRTSTATAGPSDATDGFSSAFHRIASSLPGALYQYVERPDGSASLLQAGVAFGDIMGVDPTLLRTDARRAWQYVVPDDATTVMAAIRHAGQHGLPWSGDFRVRHPDGSTRWVHVDARAERLAGGDVRWTGYLVDTTLQQFEQQALLDGERSLRFLFEHAPEAIVVVDATSGEIADLNPAAERLFGRARSEMLGTASAPVGSHRSVSDDGHRQVILEIVDEARRRGAFERRWDIQQPTGAVVPCDLRVIELPISGRSLLRCTLVDVSERERARVTQQRLEQAVGSAAHGIAMMDADASVTYANPTFLRQWRLAPDHVTRHPHLADLWPTGASCLAALDEMQRTGAWKGEVPLEIEGDVPRLFEVELSAVMHPNGNMLGGLVSVTDVTEARQLVTRVLRAQQLETVGRLAGGIAHDFNNLLTVITTSLEIAKQHPTAGRDVGAELDDATRAAESAARLARQLLTFSRQQVVPASPLDLNALVRRIAEMLPRMLGDGIDLRIQLAPDVGSVLIDKSQAEQILLNLAVNARDAMGGSGRLTIATTRRHTRAEEHSAAPEWAGDDGVELCVSDTGSGMTGDVLAHIFEPFYTTKPVGRGTGLGLSVIHGIVTQLQGRIDVDSRPGIGTAFRILLPGLPNDSGGGSLPESVPTDAMHAPVLLVEDDDTIRPLIERLLRREGFEVIACGDGTDALHWLEHAAITPRLMITDVIMPLMNGGELADRARALCPNLRVLFMSGYTADVIASEGVLGSAPLLAKPFTVSDLSRAVWTTLAS